MIDNKCEKCSGLTYYGSSKDFYIEYEYMKCSICGYENVLKTTEYKFREEMLNAK